MVNKDLEKIKILLAFVVPRCFPYVPFESMVSLLKNVNVTLQGFYNLGKYLIIQPKWYVGGTIHEARNVLAAYAVREGFDYVFFLDTDLVFSKSDDMFKLLYLAIEKNLPIVSGLYYTKTIRKHGKPVPAMWIWDEESKSFRAVIDWDKTKPIIPVDATGLGCVVINVKIFKHLEPPWFTWYEIDYKKILNGEDNVEKCIIGYGEDFSFFLRVRNELGLKPPVYVCTEVKLKHVGTFAIISDEKYEPFFDETPI